MLGKNCLLFGISNLFLDFIDYMIFGRIYISLLPFFHSFSYFWHTNNVVLSHFQVRLYEILSGPKAYKLIGYYEILLEVTSSH